VGGGVAWWRKRAARLGGGRVSDGAPGVAGRGFETASGGGGVGVVGEGVGSGDFKGAGDARASGRVGGGVARGRHTRTGGCLFERDGCKPLGEWDTWSRRVSAC